MTNVRELKQQNSPKQSESTFWLTINLNKAHSADLEATFRAH